MRTRLILVFSLILSVSSAFAQAPTPTDISDPQVLRLRTDLIQIYQLRTQTIRLYKRLEPLVAAGKSLSGDDLSDLDAITKAHSYFADELKAFEHYGEAEAFPKGEATTDQYTRWGVELVASLTFTDSVDQVVLMFEANERFRKILNQPNPTYGRPSDTLYEAMKRYYSTSRYDRRAKLIDGYQTVKNQDVFKQSPELIYLASVVAASPAFQKLLVQTKDQRSDVRSDLIKRYYELRAAYTRDRIKDFWSHRVVGAGSKVFGNLVGSIQFRHGRLYENAQVAAQLKATLKPGDLLLEATPFRATSYFIPGFYGHVALWIGTEHELQDLGLWNDPVVAKYQTQIHAGASILEALRSGVTVNPVEHFLDIDHLIVLRPGKGLALSDIQFAIHDGMSRMGQPYDFNFDVETSNKLVCSALAFKSYPKVPFRLEQTLGRWTINPDAVAEQGLPGGAFTPVLMFKNGKMIAPASMEAVLADELKDN